MNQDLVTDQRHAGLCHYWVMPDGMDLALLRRLVGGVVATLPDHYPPGGLDEACDRPGLLRPPLSSPRAARLGTLHELTKPAPVAIIAEAPRLTPKTIEAHAPAWGADYARYVGAIVDRR